MARKPSGKPVGCPPTDINFQTFEILCADWCTIEEIAAHLKISDDTLNNEFCICDTHHTVWITCLTKLFGLRTNSTAKVSSLSDIILRHSQIGLQDIPQNNHHYSQGILKPLSQFSL